VSRPKSAPVDHSIVPAVMLVASVSLALALGEVWLRWEGRFRPPPHPIVPDQDLNLWEEHKAYGYRLRPNTTATATFVPGISQDRSASRELTVQSNEAGFRDQSIADLDGRRRLIVLGDSFVMGIGVEANERFTNKIESLQPDWRVINMGISGYGLDLMLMAFERVGRELEPELVVLSIYTEDFARVRPYFQSGGYALPRYRLIDGRLVLGPHPTRRPWDGLWTTQLLRHFRWEWGGGDLRLNRAILERFVALSEEDGFDLVALFLPGFWEDHAVDVTRREFLREFTQQHGIRFLDASEWLVAAGKESTFILGDLHLNDSGHSVVAAELHESLRSIVGAPQEH